MNEGRQPESEANSSDSCSASGPVGTNLHRVMGLVPDPNSIDELTEIQPATRSALIAAGLHQIVRVAAGGYGVVCRAVDQTTGNPRAVKILLHPDEEDSRRMFQRECCILDAPEIPAGLVPRFYCAVEPPGGQPFMILEWLEGETLGDWLSARPALSASERENLCRGICHAYSRLHAAHLLQRDPSLNNIIVGPQQQVRLIDFGGGGRPYPGYRSLQTLPTVPVTHAFASEAVRSGQRRPSAADEVHAAARICFTVLTGRLADQYPQETWATLLDAAGIPRDFAGVILDYIRQPPQHADEDPQALSWSAAGLIARIDQVLDARTEHHFQNALRRSYRTSKIWMAVSAAAVAVIVLVLLIDDWRLKAEVERHDMMMQRQRFEFHEKQLQMVGRSLGYLRVLPSHAQSMLEERKRSLLERHQQVMSEIETLSAADLAVRSDKLLEEVLKLHFDHAAAIRCEEQYRRLTTLLAAVPERLQSLDDLIVVKMIAEQGTESRRLTNYEDAASRFSAACRRLERLLRENLQPADDNAIKLLLPDAQDLQLRFVTRTLDPDEVADVQYRLADSLEVPVSDTNTVGMKLRLIPAGEYQQGSPVGEIGRLPVSRRNVIDPQTGNEESREVDWERQRVVRISRPFRMSETEVTQQQWTAVMGTTPWKGQMNVDEGDLYPACWISWGEQVEFTKRLSEREQRKYRLPTEAEWEYACRAGSLESYSFGDNSLLLNNFAWTNRNSNGRAQPVGRRQPNSLGLFDLHGNLLENCLDRFAEYPAGSVTDPRCDEGEGRVRRGGSFRNDDQNNSFRSAYRTSEADDFRDRSLGFRVVQELP